MSDSSMRSPFALTAKALISAASRPVGTVDAQVFAWWADLADAIGPVLLPFLVRPECYAGAPLEELGLAPTPLRSLTPRRGEMWVLFCFRQGSMVESLRGSPLRNDGFVLILEWRKDGEDSPLLSSALRALAAQVRRQLGVEGIGLHSAFDRYGDRVDFSDAELFSDSEHVDNVASAWAALAAGLYCLMTGRQPPDWPFPSVQWDAKRGCVAGVAGLAQKLLVAADCGAVCFTIARSQRREASGILGDLSEQAGRAQLRNLQLYSLRDRDDPRAAAAEIAFGFADNRRRRRRILAAVTGPLLAMLSLWAVIKWDANRSLSKYYAGVVYHYGLPEGTFEVTPQDQKYRCSTYRFDYEGVHGAKKSIHHRWQLKSLFGRARHLVRVVSVNARNVPELRDDPFEDPLYGNVPPIQEFEYDANGKLIKVGCRRRGGRDLIHGFVEKVCHYSDRDGTINGNMSVRSGNGKAFVFADASSTQQLAGEPMDEKCLASDFVLERDADGRVIRKGYYHDSLPTTDADGVGAIAIAYDPNGMISQVLHLGGDGTNRVPDKYGVVARNVVWRAADLVEMSFTGIDGTPVFGRQGVRRLRADYDAYGNATNVVFMDASGRQEYRMRTEDGIDVCAGYEKTYSNGLECVQYMLDQTGGHRRTPDGFCGVMKRYDRLGDCILYAFVDAAGKLTQGYMGIVKCAVTRDCQTGRETQMRFFGVDGITPAYAHDERVHRIDKDYDADGNIREERLLDEYGRLMKGDSGWALAKYEYQEGKCTFAAFYDDCERPVRNRKLGYTCMRREYELQTGSEKCRRYYEDESCRTLQLDNSGLSGWNTYRDSLGRPRRVEWLGLDGMPCASNFHGAAGWRCTYENRLKSNVSIGGCRLPADCSCRDWTYLQVDGTTPCTNRYGYAKIRKYFDRCGRLAAESYHDADGKRCSVAGSDLSACIYRYGGNGELVERRAFDSGDKPTIWPGQCSHGVRMAHDDRKQIVRIVFIGETGKPSLATGQAASEIRFSYDAQGYVSKTSFWAEAGKPVLHASGGFHEKQMKNDAFGNCIEESFFGCARERILARVDGLCFWRKVTTYDQAGKVRSQRYYDTDNKLLDFSHVSGGRKEGESTETDSASK